MKHSSLASLRKHVDLVIRRLERTSFRDGRERRILTEELERALGVLPVARAGARGRDATLLLRESKDAAARVGSSLARLQALDATADAWSSALGQLTEQIATLLATEEDRLDPVVARGEVESAA